MNFLWVNQLGYCYLEQEKTLSSYYGGKSQWEKGTREFTDGQERLEVGQSSTRTKQLKWSDVKPHVQEMTVNTKMCDSYKS